MGEREVEGGEWNVHFCDFNSFYAGLSENQETCWDVIEGELLELEVKAMKWKGRGIRWTLFMVLRNAKSSVGNMGGKEPQESRTRH